MFGLGMPELIVILVIVILVFGAGRISEIGGAIGKGIKSLKKWASFSPIALATKQLVSRVKPLYN
jgi:TatA/E family protein of Tat protein translocase